MSAAFENAPKSDTQISGDLEWPPELSPQQEAIAGLPIFGPTTFDRLLAEWKQSEDEAKAAFAKTLVFRPIAAEQLTTMENQRTTEAPRAEYTPYTPTLVDPEDFGKFSFPPTERDVLGDRHILLGKAAAETVLHLAVEAPPTAHPGYVPQSIQQFPPSTELVGRVAPYVQSGSETSTEELPSVTVPEQPEAETDEMLLEKIRDTFAPEAHRLRLISEVKTQEEQVLALAKERYNKWRTYHYRPVADDDAHQEITDEALPEEGCQQEGQLLVEPEIIELEVSQSQLKAADSGPIDRLQDPIRKRSRVLTAIANLWKNHIWVSRFPELEEARRQDKQ